MKRLGFFLLYPLIWLISILPFGLLYLLSDLLFYPFYWIGYRKKLVLNNLQKAFPDKNEKELLTIRRKFYRHFLDITLESVKAFTISRSEMTKRMVYKNPEIIHNLTGSGKSVIIMGGHYGNWEWTTGLSMKLQVPGYVTYTRLSNPYFNRQIKKSRSRFGAKLITRSETIAQIRNNALHGNPAVYGLLSDQSPQLGKAYYWTEFFGVRVPVHTGAEWLAKRYDIPVVFIQVKKIRRGYYEAELELITDRPANFPDYVITDIFLRKTENLVREAPEYYLWTHNRFKHAGKEPV